MPQTDYESQLIFRQTDRLNGWNRLDELQPDRTEIIKRNWLEADKDDPDLKARVQELIIAGLFWPYTVDILKMFAGLDGQAALPLKQLAGRLALTDSHLKAVLSRLGRLVVFDDWPDVSQTKPWLLISDLSRTLVTPEAISRINQLGQIGILSPDDQTILKARFSESGQYLASMESVADRTGFGTHVINRRFRALGILLQTDPRSPHYHQRLYEYGQARPSRSFTHAVFHQLKKKAPALIESGLLTDPAVEILNRYLGLTGRPALSRTEIGRQLGITRDQVHWHLNQIRSLADLESDRSDPVDQTPVRLDQKSCYRARLLSNSGWLIKQDQQIVDNYFGLNGHRRQSPGQIGRQLNLLDQFVVWRLVVIGPLLTETPGGPGYQAAETEYNRIRPEPDYRLEFDDDQLRRLEQLINQGYLDPDTLNTIIYYLGLFGRPGLNQIMIADRLSLPLDEVKQHLTWLKKLTVREIGSAEFEVIFGQRPLPDIS